MAALQGLHVHMGICYSGTSRSLDRNNELVRDKSSFCRCSDHACPVLLNDATESVDSDASARDSLMAEIKDACRGQYCFTAEIKCCQRGNCRNDETSLAWGLVLWWVGDVAANCICSAQF